MTYERSVRLECVSTHFFEMSSRKGMMSSDIYVITVNNKRNDRCDGNDRRRLRDRCRVTKKTRERSHTHLHKNTQRRSGGRHKRLNTPRKGVVHRSLSTPPQESAGFTKREERETLMFLCGGRFTPGWRCWVCCLVCVLGWWVLGQGGVCA